jgi:hypothetical protein
MSRRKSRFQEQREKKDRRTKIVAVGAAVLLAAILAFELPHYLGGHKSSPAAAATTPTTSENTPGSTAVTTAPSTAIGVTATAVAVPTTGSTKLPNSDAAPTRTKSQLYSFGRFAGKDPFVQQVSAQAAPPASSSSSSSTPSSSTSAPTSGSGTSSKPQVQQTSARGLASRGVARISVNGRSEVVRLGGSFPSTNPVFKLVSLANGAVNIGIASGSYTSGARTVKLSSGRSLTLVDTADGARYRLRLLSGS